MARDNWGRSRIISDAAQRILETVDDDFLEMKPAAQARETLKLRRRIADETGCDLSTTSRHLSRGSIIRFLQGK